MSTLFKRDFILLWQGHLVSAVGTQLFNVGLMYWLLETTGSATIMGFVLMTTLLPVAILSIFTGALVDRLPRKFLIVGADVIRGVLCLSFTAAIVYTNTETAVGLLFFYAFFSGIAASVFSPALRAAMPEVVGRENLQRANGMLQGASSFAGTVGAIAGGFVYAVLGATTLFLLNGVSFLLSALSESFAKIPNNPNEKTKANLIDDVKEGLTFMYRDLGLRRILITIALMNVVNAPLILTLPMLVRDHHGSGPELLGMLAASQSIGSLIAAALLSTRSLPSKVSMTLSWVSLTICAISLIAMVTFEHKAIVILAFCVYGTGIVCFNIPIQSAIQLRTPSNLRGRVIAASTTVVACIVPIAAAVTGIVIDAMGQNIPIIWTATACILIASAISLAVSPHARRYLAAQ